MERMRAGRLIVGLVLIGAIAGCTSEGSPDDEETPDAGTSPKKESEFTEPGSELEVGQDATLAWHPAQGVDAKIDVTVTALERTTFKQTFQGWKLTDKTKSRAPYFVRAKVTNSGDAPVEGGPDVPLYGLDGANNLVEASDFDSDFDACRPATLPQTFKPGDSVKACLVVLVPDKGDLVGATFRPTEETDPITWTGPLERYQPPKKKDRQGDRNSG